MLNFNWLIVSNLCDYWKQCLSESIGHALFVGSPAVRPVESRNQKQPINITHMDKNHDIEETALKLIYTLWTARVQAKYGSDFRTYWETHIEGLGSDVDAWVENQIENILEEHHMTFEELHAAGVRALDRLYP